MSNHDTLAVSKQTTPPTVPDLNTANGRYSSMETGREPFLRRARECAALTIPALVPPQGHGAMTELPTPYQSVGARGLNNLTAKLTMTLQPSNQPFFRMDVDSNEYRQLAQQDERFKIEIRKALAEIERGVMKDIETSGDRPAIVEALKQLLCAGNVLLYVGPDGTKIFQMDRYVVRRDAMGRPLEIIVKETFAPASLPDAALEALQGTAYLDGGGVRANVTKSVDVYTHIVRKRQQWFVYQEIQGVRISGTNGQHPLEKSPWLALRLVRIDGEDYGRGYVEEYLGDLKSLEALSQAIVEASAAAAKVLFFVKPNGTTSLKTVSRSPNGAVRQGNAEDVSTLQLDKFADLRTARATADAIEDRLGFAFLLNTAVQRSGERVTAEEIRFMARELEDGLGGIYTLLTEEMQRPYIHLKIASLTKKGVIPTLPKGLVRIQITTGLAALGRSHDREKLTRYVKDLIDAFGADEVIRRVNVTEYAERLALADGIDTDGLLKTQEQIDEDDKQARQAAMADAATPEMVKQIGGAAQTAMNPQQQQEGGA